LLAGDVESWEPPAVQPAAAGSPAEAERIARLESEFEKVRAEVDELKQQFADFRKQFE
jgi:hypothetical protein